MPISIEDLPRLSDHDREALDDGYVAIEGDVAAPQIPLRRCDDCQLDLGRDVLRALGSCPRWGMRRAGVECRCSSFVPKAAAVVAALVALSGCSLTPTQQKWAGFAAGVLIVAAIGAIVLWRRKLRRATKLDRKHCATWLTGASVTEKAVQLGCKFPHNVGINWTFAEGFPSEEKAMEFVEWLEANGYEHRGFYAGTQGGLNSVRYRRVKGRCASLQG